jgi:hypothetical protein
VDFLLQVHAHGTIGANDFIGTNSGIGWNVSTRIRDPYIRSFIAHDMVCTFDCGSCEAPQEILPGGGDC